jgi:TonB family protein
VSLQATRSWLTTAIFAALIAMSTLPATQLWAQDDLPRKVKSRVAPIYPALAKQMNITGTVKVQVTIAPNGSVKTAKLVGGHPLLANAAMDAIKKWRFDTGPEETVGIVEFKFDPSAGVQ